MDYYNIVSTLSHACIDTKMREADFSEFSVTQGGRGRPQTSSNQKFLLTKIVGYASVVKKSPSLAGWPTPSQD